MEILPLQIATLIITIVIPVWLTSYIKKKGENAAQKEDLTKLTTIVKEVEYKFGKETEELKAKLNLSNQLEFNLRNEARLALIDLFKKVNAHYNLLSHNEFMVKDFENWREFDKAIENREQSYVELENIMSLVELFIPDDEVGDELKGLIGDVLVLFIDQAKVFNKYANKHRENAFENKNKINLFYSEQEVISSYYDKEIIAFENRITPLLRDVTVNVRSYLKYQAS